MATGKVKLSNEGLNPLGFCGSAESPGFPFNETATSASV